MDVLQKLRAEVQHAWDANAEFWDQRMGEGNTFHRHLNVPFLDRMLGIHPGERVLEVACGNGQFARHLAELGAQVVAVDASPRMLERARAHPTPPPGKIGYRQLDVTDPDALGSVRDAPFEAVVANMALMDIPAIEPLARALPSLLDPGGPFVFTVCHPAFNSSSVRRTISEEDPEGRVVQTHAVIVTRYATPTSTRSIAMIGQPEVQPFFDRSLADLLAPFLREGFVVDALEERVFPPGVEGLRPFAWENFREIPPMLGARLRRYPRDASGP
ncbi:MAG: class I SAM-dependent methyltransferase [Thermoplasmata archaeon]|nr:class I SAM-dependent methyltransferase [Thermoplasmata archaeon]